MPEHPGKPSTPPEEITSIPVTATHNPVFGNAGFPTPSPHCIEIADLSPALFACRVAWGYDNGGLTGTATLTQNLTFCTSSHYAFSAYVGRRPVGTIYNATITVYLGNTVLVPTQKTCIDANDCKLNPPGVSDDYYRHLSAAVPFPPPSAAVLKVVIYRESNGNPPPLGFDTLLDDVTITKVG